MPWGREVEGPGIEGGTGGKEDTLLRDTQQQATALWLAPFFILGWDFKCPEDQVLD